MTYDDNLIRMANQIGIFFESMPDRQEALDGVATHLKKFWDPRMRQALLQHVDRADAGGIRDIVLAAIRERRALIE